jgi:hypothetical protein
MIANDHVRFGRGSSGKGPAKLAPRPTAYLTASPGSAWGLAGPVNICYPPLRMRM